MKTTITEPNVLLVTLRELREGDTFRWADKDDANREHVCIVLSYDSTDMIVKDLTAGSVYTRQPRGDDLTAYVNRLRITSIEATL